MKKLFILLTNLLCVSAIFYHNGSDHQYSACNVKEVYNSEGHIKIALLVNECLNAPQISWTYINSTIWIINKLNSINFTMPLQLGLSVFQICSEADYYNPIYKLYKEDGIDYVLGIISTNAITSKIRSFADSLGTNLRTIDKYRKQLVEAVVKLLNKLTVTNGVMVYSENQIVLQEFYKYTWEAKICVQTGYILNNETIQSFMELADNSTTVVVVFAGTVNIKALTSNIINEESGNFQIIFAPFDETETIEFPERSLIVKPSYSSVEVTFNESSHLFFEVANPILNLVLNVSNFVKENCNETMYKINCFQNRYSKILERQYLKFTQFQVLNFLKSEYLQETFIYKIFRVENSNLKKQINVYNYKIFENVIVDTSIQLNSNVGSLSLCGNCSSSCINFKLYEFHKPISIANAFLILELRSDAWVFGVLAISVLGLSFCLAIFIFLVIRFCKRDILEGNPALTIFLLISVMLMYCSVIPFSLYSDKELQTTLCIIRALSSTLSYAFALSLLLSRSILLATINKEVGFMAHISGPVQSFLTLFIFGVQGALSLQFLSHCRDVFRGISFVYLMSYNIILLVLLVFISPLNARVQRNYKEGKHFTIAVALTACAWSCWIPGYAVFKESWRDPIICFGLLATASIFLGSIFIPRTYMMTISAARDRISNALPSLPTSSSIMDVYRANGQPVYDCINIAAINAAAVARHSIAPPPPPPQPEIYSAVRVPAYDDDYDFARCVTPSNSDKVTRF